MPTLLHGAQGIAFWSWVHPSRASRGVADWGHLKLCCLETSVWRGHMGTLPSEKREALTWMRKNSARSGLPPPLQGSTQRPDIKLWGQITLWSPPTIYYSQMRSDSQISKKQFRNGKTQFQLKEEIQTRLLGGSIKTAEKNCSPVVGSGSQPCSPGCPNRPTPRGWWPAEPAAGAHLASLSLSKILQMFQRFSTYPVNVSGNICMFFLTK